MSFMGLLSLYVRIKILIFYIHNKVLFLVKEKEKGVSSSQ